MVHPCLRVDENGSKAIPDTPWPDDFDLVAPGVERVERCLGETSLDLQTVRIGSMRPGRLGEARATEAWGFDGLLHVQAKVDDVGKYLQAALRLAVTTGSAERHAGLALFEHDEGARCRARPFVRRQGVGVVRVQPEVAPAAVDQDACVT